MKPNQDSEIRLQREADQKYVCNANPKQTSNRKDQKTAEKRKTIENDIGDRVRQRANRNQWKWKRNKNGTDDRNNRF